MKIICEDNFNRESVSDRLVAENIQDSDEAKTMTEALNKNFSSHASPFYFRLVADGFKLHVYDPT